MIKSSWFVGQMTARLRGIGTVELGNVRTPRINPADLGAIAVTLPPRFQQHAIANYLDRETAHIDGLIEKKRRLIGLVTERVRSFISLATDDPPYIPVRHLTSLRTSGPRGWADRVAETGPPFIRSANLRRDSIDVRFDNLAFVDAPRTEEARRSAVCEGDVLVGIQDSLDTPKIVVGCHPGVSRLKSS
jgi:type I restriction enzyme S subunit